MPLLLLLPLLADAALPIRFLLRALYAFFFAILPPLRHAVYGAMLLL